ncbi:MAG: glycosyltransferase family 1 protein [Chloroflexota bacterium]
MSDKQTVAVDLTPLTKNAGIGGARMLAVELIGHFGGDKSAFEYLLLTSEDSHDELSVLDAPNVRRVCIIGASSDTPLAKTQQYLHRMISFVFPRKIQQQIKKIYRKAFPFSAKGVSLSELGVDLLFCPFTGPLFHTSGIPTISVVLDLQFLKFPENFSKNSLVYLNEHYQEACEFSDRLITISEFVKHTILENSTRGEDDISVIYAGIHNRLNTQVTEMPQMGKSAGLVENEYLFFPAKYWPHKNHRNALQGFKLFLAGHSQLKKLVFSGISPQAKDDLQALVNKFGLEEKVVIFGWEEEDTLAALYKFCWAVFFPSMYEGFGIPVIEGFSFEKPVLCSNVTSLPEVGGDAALYFDPTDIEDIARVISDLADHPEISAALVEKGRAQLSRFSNSQGVALQYETVFKEVLGGT